MRKILITLLLCCAMVQMARAQFYVGGHIGMTSSFSQDSGIGLTVAPDIGYRIDKVLTVGSTLSFQTRHMVFGLTPYLRAHVLNYSGFRLFVSANVPMRFQEDYKSYGLTFRPGIMLRVSPGIWMTCQVGNFGYSHIRSHGQTSSGWTGKLDYDNISMGLFFSL